MEERKTPVTTVCIHQPDFIPWLGFFDRLIKSDVFVILDNVQFLRRGWHHRDRIKTASGPMWLTVPVKKKGRYRQLINEVEIDDSQSWRRRHLKSFQSWYARAPYFNAYLPLVRSIYEKNHQMLVDFNVTLIKFLMAAFEIEVETRFASSLGGEGRSTDLLVEIVRAVGGDSYLSGAGARSYLDEVKFTEGGIRVKWQEFQHPVYPQLYGEFTAGLSGLDLLFNCGDESASILRSGMHALHRDGLPA